uniref:Ribosomal protein S11 n=1 Tax=Goniomonas avonlea TaxID=1255295 RepID=A0A348G6K4_9CRYP|nr:ribosomal protein S11 [Goniomonas avonlea]
MSSLSAEIISGALFQVNKNHSLCVNTWHKKIACMEKVRRRWFIRRFYLRNKCSCVSLEQKFWLRSVKRKRQKFSRRNIRLRSKLRKSKGIIHFFVSSNNIFISFCDVFGRKLFGVSAGDNGFRKSKRSSVYAAQVVVKRVMQWFNGKIFAQFGTPFVRVIVVFNGRHKKRIAAAKFLKTKRLRVTFFCDTTQVPHAGCKAPKRRRL